MFVSDAMVTFSGFSAVFYFSPVGMGRRAPPVREAFVFSVGIVPSMIHVGATSEIFFR